MKKGLTEKQIERFYANLISCLPELSREKILFYSKNKRALKSKLTVLSLLPSEERKITQTIAWLGNQEVRDIDELCENINKKDITTS